MFITATSTDERKFSSQLQVDMDAEFNMDLGTFGLTDQDRLNLSNFMFPFV